MVVFNAAVARVSVVGILSGSVSIYAHIGQRIRTRRKQLKLSQSELAGLMGFSCQQMQKYEAGASKMDAGKLFLLAKVLNVPPSYFYEGVRIDESIGKRIDTDIIQRIRTEPLRVLLVDDIAEDVISFRKAVHSSRLQVIVHTLHEAGAVTEFLQTYERQQGRKNPDVIVLALTGARAANLELLKMVKKHPRTKDVPVLALSNGTSAKDMIEAYKLGAASYIQKSTEFDDFGESLETLIRYWSKVVTLPCM